MAARNGKMKYYRDRGDLMDLFGVVRSKWTIMRYGECLVATSSMGNQIWAKNIAEMRDLLLNAGVDQRDIRFGN